MESEMRTAHSATQRFGLLLLAAVGLTFVIISIATGAPTEDLVFAVVILAVVGGAAWVVGKFDATWARVVGLVATLAFAFMVWWLVFGLFQVFSPIEFIVGLLTLLGFFISLVGGIRALVSAGREETEDSDGGARFRKGVLAVLGAAAVISIVGFFVTKETVDAAAASGATPIEMVAFEFEPASSTVPEGATLLVRNTDPFVHDFTFDPFGIAVTIGPGSEVLVDLSSVPAGSYTYYCSLHSDGVTDMVGSITVGS